MILSNNKEDNLAAIKYMYMSAYMFLHRSLTFFNFRIKRAEKREDSIMKKGLHIKLSTKTGS